ncbi:unknown [Prevotella sp. CAG:1185]|nr:unknown [Prevotella sp. CAG:1185]
MGEPFFIIMFFAILAVPALNDNYFFVVCGYFVSYKVVVS